MQPTAYPINEGALSEFWQRFTTSGDDGPLRDFVPDPTVVQSWRRCSLRLSPYAPARPTILKESALTAVYNRQQNLISVAIPFLEDIHQFMEGADCVIVLADRSACILEMVGEATIRLRLRDLYWGCGAYWSEGQMGTNALGLCLRTATPVQVVGAEHYFAQLHEFVTTAAPIHAVNGRIIGIIAVIGLLKEATSHTLSLVMAVARALSNQLHLEWLLTETNQHLSEVSTLLTAVSEGVIAWNASGRITHINQQVGDILKLKPAAITGQIVSDVITLPPILTEAMHTLTEIENVEAQLEVDSAAIPLLVSLRVVRESPGQVMGFILIIKPIAQVRRLVQQQVGSYTSMTLADFQSGSPAIQRALRQAVVVARGRAPVLISGEEGVGKNLMAHAIHNSGFRADGPFIAINCRAIPRELMVAEFLGYEDDAAGNGRPSKFELADGGTLLLDQVESLSLEMQSALLHVIKNQSVMRLHSVSAKPVDVRIIATTSENLEQYVADGRLLPQLYHRFGVFNLNLPPLRRRVEDIPLLAGRFLARFPQDGEEAVLLEDQALDVLQRYPWPGNVRELEGVLELALNSSDGLIQVKDLPEKVRNGRVLTGKTPQPQPVLTVAEMEREAIIRAGWSCQGRVSEMAEQLGIGRTTLWRKMRRLQLTPQQFKPGS